MNDNNKPFDKPKVEEKIDKVYDKNDNKSRCLACWFFDCRCKESLPNKRVK